MKLYSIYDKKAKQFSDPTMCINDDVAKRMMQQTLSKTMFPDDYELYMVGEFDVDSGFIVGDGVKIAPVCISTIEEN